ncbi:MAG: CoA transferase [Gammaproteobacteria bacterium]|nr:CoA transferase [Gammaproteobacteria bacterium]
MFDRSFIVLELANILAGPLTTMSFAELGARVIKLENPRTQGDATRGWKLVSEPRDTDISAYFACANWGKESLACNYMKPAGLEVAHALVRRADIVVASFKPGDEIKLKLDYATLAAINPRLIYGQITAYGPDDPRPGFDAILQAESGFTFLNGEPDGPPTKMPVALVDILLAHQLKQGLLLALLKRERTGQGSLVITSLLEAGVASLANQATNYLVADTVPQRMGSEHPNIVPYGSILECRDGRELVIAAATERQYRELVRALGLPELAEDPKFATGQQRVERRTELLDRIRAQAAKIESDELARRFEAAKVPYGFVNDMAAVFEQPGARHLLLESECDGRLLRGVRTVAIGGDAAVLSTPEPPPHLHQHAESILRDFLGYEAAEIERLGTAGAFGDAA